MSSEDGFAVLRGVSSLEIRLTRPTQLNALTAETLNDLADLLHETASDPAIRVVTLTGEGRAFCSGADLGEPDNEDGSVRPRHWVATLNAANRVIQALQATPQPVIAVVNGPAVGFGCSLALASDLIIASEKAYFLLAFTDVALMPDGGASLLVAASIGRSRALHLALVPERVPARAALEWGLIYKVVPGSDLDSAATELVDRLANGAPRALAKTKSAINGLSLSLLDQALALETAGQSELLADSDFQEAISAFRDKRPPSFMSR